jgi:hypothetical protein
MLCVLALLSAMPDVAVVASSGRDRTQAVSPEIISRMHKALEAVGLTVRDAKPASGCEGRTACLGELASTLGAVVVGVDAAKVGGVIGAHFEAVRPGGKEALCSGEFAADAKKWREVLDARLTVFAHELKDKLPEPEPPKPEPEPEPKVEAPPPEPEPKPEPRVVVVTPVEKPPPPAPAQAAPPARSIAVPLTLGIFAAASAVAAVVFGVISLSTIDDYNQHLRAMDLPRAELEQRARSGNLYLTATLITGLAAAAFTLGAVILAVRD